MSISNILPKSSGALPFNKANFHVLEQERNLLKITLEYVVKENETLKNQNEDMRMTVKHNKELLKEYVEKITNKDKVVEKMSSTIEQLYSRIKALEDHIKHLYNILNLSFLRFSKREKIIAEVEKEKKEITFLMKNEINSKSGVNLNLISKIQI